MLRHSALFCIFGLAALGSSQTRSHPYDLQHVKWHVVLDELNKSLKGDITNRIKPNKGVREVWFDRGELNISAAYAGPLRVPFRISGEKVYVMLPKSAGDSVDIRFLYSGKPRAGLYFVPAKRAFPAKTSVIYTQGEMEDNRFWLVTYDYPDDKATSEGIIDVPATYFALSNGKMLSKKSEGKRAVYHWKMDQPHVTYLLAFIAGQYDKGHEAWGALPVDWYVPKGLKEMGASAFNGTADMVRVYSEVTGFKYPYAKFSQGVVPDYMFGGMENITMVTNTIGALHPYSAKPIANSEGLVLHELAHQWFGDTVTTNGWADGWINEGWASFLPAFYLRQKAHPAGWTAEDEFGIYRYDTFNGGLSAHREKPYRGMVYTGYKDPLDMFDSFLYPGGASRMFMLMDMLGEKQFWAACKQYLNERKYTSFDTRAFFATWSKASGRDLTPFMTQWFYRNAAPNISGKWDGDSVVISQPLPHFDLQVPVWVLNGSSWIKKSVHLEAGEARVPFPEAAGKPFLIDPDVWLMANISYTNELSFEDRLGLLKAAPNAGAQMRILDQLLRGRSSEEALRVANSINKPNLLVRYMSEIRPTTDEDASAAFLLHMLDHPDKSIVNAAAGRFGSLEAQVASAAVRVKLRDLAENDANDLVRQTAFRSLLSITGDPDMAKEAWQKTSYNDGYRQIALDWWAAHEKETARERALDAIREQLPEPTRVNAIRYLGTLKDRPGEHEVFDVLMGVLKEDSFGARNTAISALGTYGNKAAVPALRPFQKHPLVFFRQTADRVIAQLEKG